MKAVSSRLCRGNPDRIERILRSWIAPRTARSLWLKCGRLVASPLVGRDSAKRYGFVDSFRLDPPKVSEQSLGMDQGPMLLAIENARTGLIGKLFSAHPAARSATQRLGWKRR